MNLYKLTDFGDQSIIIGSRVDYLRKNNLRLVKSDWLAKVNNKIDNSFKFRRDYGFDEQAFLQYYNLRAVQFGNWLDYGDRADHFLALVQALGHLALIIDSENIGWYNQLSIALGARGKTGALAHYEPGMKVINLTKQKGGSSFAHEYGHAIDFIGGQYFSKNNKIYSLSAAQLTETDDSNAKTDEVRNLMNIVLDGVRAGERYPALVKWAKAHRKYGYWCCNTEIWARTFAQFVALKCKNREIVDTVLCAKVDTGDVANIPVKELETLAPYIEKLVKLCSKYLNNGTQPPKATIKNPFKKTALNYCV